MLNLLSDTSSSVMDEMNALFAPPGREIKKSGQKQDLHPYYKRPGKGHNHDCCDACGEGGDLICCDSCPASFHLKCHTPPLEEEDIPMGDWECLRCYYRIENRSSAIGFSLPTGNLGSSEIISPIDGLPSHSKHAQNLHLSRNSQRKNDVSSKTVKLYKDRYDRYLKIIHSHTPTKTPFDVLIAASQIVNATSFSLPKELSPNEPLPLTWKWANERLLSDAFKAKNCRNCHKSSRAIPSISCDFCASAYHLDCLDPPLCDVPKGRWICPNHLENFIDSELVTSTRLSERIRLWGKYARAPVDTESVRLDFLRKIRSGRLVDSKRSRRINIPRDKRIKVPEFIKQKYANPSVIVPPADYALPYKPLIQSVNADSDEWLANLVLFQTNLVELKLNEETKVMKSNSENNCLPPEDAVKGRASPTPSDSSTVSNVSLDLHPTDNISQDVIVQLKEYLARQSSSSRLSQLNPIVREFLAVQRMKQLFPFQKKVTANAVNHRAALYPLNSRRPPLVMPLRILRIGAESILDWHRCQYISNQHANIFYDSNARCFELINLSEHGTCVDNFTYTLNLTTGEDDSSDTNRKGKKMPCADAKMSRICLCTSSMADEMSESGCENSAVLHHGSYVRFGCLEFVFCISTYIENGDVEHPNNHQVDNHDCLKIEPKT